MLLLCLHMDLSIFEYFWVLVWISWWLSSCTSYSFHLIGHWDLSIPGDPWGTFKPSWDEPHVIRKLTLEVPAWLTYLDRNQFLDLPDVDWLPKYHVWDHGHRMSGFHFGHLYILSPLLTYRPLLTYWASYAHHNLSLLIAFLTFLHRDRVPLVYACFVKSFISLRPMSTFSLSFVTITSLYFIKSYCLCHSSSFFPLYYLFLFIFPPSWVVIIHISLCGW